MGNVTVSKEDIMKVKALGCLHNKGTDNFSVRVVTRNGKITSKEAMAIAEASEKFGNGFLAMTSRMSVEIQGIHYDNIEPMREFLRKYGLETGGTGKKVRPVVSCKGTTCQYGLYDTFGLSEKIHERFYKGYSKVTLPHKFKIATGGCPNNCVKPDLNDIGVIGQKIPSLSLDLCRGCKVCQMEKACPVSVPKVADGKVYINPELCNQCGRCIGKCPFKVSEEYVNGYKITVGGRWGKRVAMGKPLSRIVTSEDEVLDVIEKSILLFKDKGIDGERFADTIEKIGFENAEAELFGNDLLNRKEEITGGC